MTNTRPVMRFHFFEACVAVIVLLAMPTPRTLAASSALEPPVKFGFTKSMFVDLNPGDTKAAVKSYAKLLASKNDLTISDSPGVLDDVNAVKESFAQGSADIISLTTLEFLELPAGSTNPRMISASMGGTFTENYVLLVHRNSGYQTVADLKNKRVLIYNSLRGTLSSLWLDVLLATNGQKEAAQYFVSLTPVTKPSRTILPVFFRQADACIVTQNGFNIIGEMNPQVMKDLKILATSPSLIPSVTCIRAGISAHQVDRIVSAVVDAQHTVSGRQILTIFQCDQIAETDSSQIESVRELLATRNRLRGNNDTEADGQPKPSPTPNIP